MNAERLFMAVVEAAPHYGILAFICWQLLRSFRRANDRLVDVAEKSAQHIGANTATLVELVTLVRGLNGHGPAGQAPLQHATEQERDIWNQPMHSD